MARMEPIGSLWNHVPNLAPFHLLAYSTLLGSQLYQSFVMTKVCFQALPRTAFTTLQKRIFPIYFQGQSLLIVLTILTQPPHGPMSFLKTKWNWIPLALAGATAAMNMCVYGPRTQSLMVQRIHQETRDRVHKINEEVVSNDMQKLGREFSRAHAMSIHLNLVTILATVIYGWRLASKMEVNLM
ncbi:hypothetical protein BU24DRAFT_419418 [Aaosphaeria arxii CBS 175.79]|uniref:TMEM205-like domain-containing protein n=1 Tax=Aaosphaeria arxii CBS 175.79 TaxID=1450172 RepID=A0A6A5Y458_9PLEO|nr:uncharacterized protein BU24DRAFT_419418 [Aaosphaeria arxii CBS 175.79]KAF2019807.1 hypothetical protein BU24DRAFT_419418 [Aaosphaeria arxii CBS 175.79]